MNGDLWVGRRVKINAEPSTLNASLAASQSNGAVGRQRRPLCGPCCGAVSSQRALVNGARMSSGQHAVWARGVRSRAAPSTERLPSRLPTPALAGWRGLVMPPTAGGGQLKPRPDAGSAPTGAVVGGAAWGAERSSELGPHRQASPPWRGSGVQSVASAPPRRQRPAPERSALASAKRLLPIRASSAGCDRSDIRALRLQQAMPGFAEHCSRPCG